MMKRLKYISRFATDLSRADIAELVMHASNRNQELEITGVLMTTGKLFFQVLEGPAENVDTVFGDIRRDQRHMQVLVLAEEHDVHDRIFPDWSMRKLSLDELEGSCSEPIRAILETVVENQERTAKLTAILERAIWTELSKG